MMRVARAAVPATVSAVLAMGLAACGSSGSSTSSSAGTGSNASAHASYQSVIKKYLVPYPSTWQGPSSAPKPAAHKTIALISAAEVLEGAHRLIVGASAAAKALGWNAYVCDGKGDPNQQNICTQQAIQKKVDGIFWAGIDPSVVRQGADAAQAAGIPIVTGYDYGRPTSAPPANVPKSVIADVSSDQCSAGKALAAYIFANTQGTPKVAMINDPEFPIVELRYECTKQALQAGGADILSSTDIRGADVATQGPGLGSSILQQHPQGTINWIYAPYDAASLFIGQGITSTGRSDVRMVSFDANKANLALMQKGSAEVADVYSPLEWMGWAAVDALNRKFNNATVAQSYAMPVLVLTPKTLNEIGQIPNYQQHFLQIWGK